MKMFILALVLILTLTLSVCSIAGADAKTDTLYQVALLQSLAQGHFMDPVPAGIVPLHIDELPYQGDLCCYGQP